MIPYSRQLIEEDDIEAVANVLRGDWLTTGPHVDEFEHALAALVEAEYAVAFSNGTAALHGALHAAGIGAGDQVVTTPLSFSASANCARYVGAEPTFVDIDPDTLNLDLEAVRSGDALVAVHFSGLPVDLGTLAHRPRVVVEDAAQALGASTPDGPVGNCAHSDMATFSFHPVKTITTGEGGAVTTNDADLAARLRRFRSHGIVGRPDLGGWAYDIEELGYNYRLTDIQAALGTSQLKKVERFVTRRNELAARYREQLADVPIQLPPEPPAGVVHARHLFPIQVDDRRGWYDRLRSADIGAQVHHMPIPALSVHGTWDEFRATYPNCAAAYDRILSIPLHPGLSEADQDRVIAELRKQP